MVTRSEEDVGLYIRNYHLVVEGDKHRVGYYYHAQNNRFSKSKKIDYLGFLKNGRGFAIEVKEITLPESKRFDFDKFSKKDNDGIDQEGHLTCIHNSSAVSTIWLQEKVAKRRGKDRAAFLTWEEWNELRTNPPMKTYKNGREPRPYKSISLDDIFERYPHSEMVYHKGQWWSKFEADNNYTPRSLFTGRPLRNQNDTIRIEYTPST